VPTALAIWMRVMPHSPPRDCGFLTSRERDALLGLDGSLLSKA